MLEITLREPTPQDLAIGRGEPSGKDGQWRVVEIHGDGPLVVHYKGAEKAIGDLQAWSELPAIGIQAIVTTDRDIAKNADEYRWKGVSKFGLYIEDDPYNSLIERVCRG